VRHKITRRLIWIIGVLVFLFSAALANVGSEQEPWHAPRVIMEVAGPDHKDLYIWLGPDKDIVKVEVTHP
jgi:hypothetical protein